MLAFDITRLHPQLPTAAHLFTLTRTGWGGVRLVVPGSSPARHILRRNPDKNSFKATTTGTVNTRKSNNKTTSRSSTTSLLCRNSQSRGLKKIQTSQEKIARLFEAVSPWIVESPATPGLSKYLGLIQRPGEHGPILPCPSRRWCEVRRLRPAVRCPATCPDLQFVCQRVQPPGSLLATTPPRSDAIAGTTEATAQVCTSRSTGGFHRSHPAYTASNLAT